MIYLIGGAPRVGKSIVAKRIADSQHATFVSTDEMCDQTMQGLSEEERKVRFPFSGFSGEASENVLTPTELVELQITSSKSLAPELGRLISSAIAKDNSLVIEGVHLLPEFVSGLITKYGADQFKAIFIGLSDVGQVIAGIMKNTSPDNWMRESNPAVVGQVAEFVAAFSEHTQSEAERNNLRYQERTEDFEGDMQRLSEQLLGDRLK